MEGMGHERALMVAVLAFGRVDIPIELKFGNQAKKLDLRRC